MIESIAIFSSQLLLVFLKHLNVRLINNHKVTRAITITALIQLSWLVSSALGIKGFLDGDYKLVIVYVAGGMIGSWLNFKIKV